MKRKDKKHNESGNKSSANWGMIGAIAAILALIVAVYAIWPKKTDPKDSIVDKIGIIKKSFHPDDIPLEFDSIDFVNAFKGYQNDVLKLCDDWLGIEKDLSFSETGNNKTALIGRLDYYRIGSNEMTKNMKSIVLNIGLLTIETELFKNKSNWKINIDECQHLKDLMDLKGERMEMYIAKTIKYMEKGDVGKAIMVLDNMKNDNEYYMFDYEFFKYCIQVKRCCDNILYDNGIKY